MNPIRTSLLQASALALAAAVMSSTAAAAGTVEVTWLQPDQYADAGRSLIDRERTLKALENHLQALGRKLPDGQTLRVQVLDLNLAGEEERFGWSDLRVMRGRADWPVILLRYELIEGPRSLRSGETRLADMNYLGHARAGDLAYEKRLLDAWFKDNFTNP